MSHPLITGWATESATTRTPPVHRVTESGAVAKSGGRLLVTLITPGQGSSGYYAPNVLEAAGSARVFPAGTQMHVDHATESEHRERGIRSVQTLAAVTTEDARWDGNALVAEARPIGPWGQVVREAEGAIGVSINAAATWAAGEDADGNPASVIEALLPHVLNTVDFVTAPGRGGSFQVLEAGRVAEDATVATFLEARVHQHMSALFADMYGEGRLTREEWDALQGAASAALTSITAAISAIPALSQRHPWAEALTDSPAQEAGDAPTNPAASNPTSGNPTKEDTLPKIEIDEQEYATLRESAGRAETLQAQVTALEAEKQAAEEKAKADRVSAAEAVVTEAYGENAPAFIVEAAKYAAEQDTFNAAEVREAAKAIEAKSAGQPAGLGSTVTESKALPSDDDIANAL